MLVLPNFYIIVILAARCQTKLSTGSTCRRPRSRQLPPPYKGVAAWRHDPANLAPRLPPRISLH